jgi:hypothetical protein
VGFFILSRGDGPAAHALSLPDARKVALFEADLRATLSLDDRIPAPTYGHFLHSVDAVIAVAGSNPDALYVDGRGRVRTLRRLLLAASLRLGLREPELAAELVQGVEEPHSF